MPTQVTELWKTVCAVKDLMPAMVWGVASVETKAA